MVVAICRGAPMGWPLATSHRMMVLSRLPEAKVRPSGVNATENTTPVCVFSGAPLGLPSATSHRMIVLSKLPETRVRPTHSQPLNL